MLNCVMNRYSFEEWKERICGKEKAMPSTLSLITLLPYSDLLV